MSITIGICISSCATALETRTDQLLKRAQNSSCEQPLIIKHANAQAEISEAERFAQLQLMGYEAPKPISDQNCDGADISLYDVQLGQGAEGAAGVSQRLYVRHMTAAQIKADPTVRCKPRYTQIYQPPLKLGGSGRVIQIPNGEECGDF